jgi:molybdopterin synthase catalytic subunit
MITHEPIRVAEYLSGSRRPEEGAAVMFAGVVRADEKDGRRVTHIHYECYEEMAEREMTALVDSIEETTGVSAITAVHRVGDVPVGEVSLLVVVTAGHRAEAYEASRLVVEEIKRRVPIWKKEVYDDESGKWL